jgi:hypothetical protein
MRRTLNFHFQRVQFDFHFTVARIDVIKRLKIGRASPLRGSDRRRGELVARKLRPAARRPGSVVIMVIAIATR